MTISLSNVPHVRPGLDEKWEKKCWNRYEIQHDNKYHMVFIKHLQMPTLNNKKTIIKVI